ncbi:POT family-domain-containing protein [Leucosporidium creatinivorum]|uniref:POT family-domain-containing protein n=1 Tax=Leucosporidium creatinivorum TaxID=106004 RepID=A0A1Y2DGG2_9BASI|nr:POT family-domain-containing protein [Leucosporidium creatinivorum]
MRVQTTFLRSPLLSCRLNIADLVLSPQLAERFSYYGSTVVFTNFIQRGLPAGSTTGSVSNADTQRAGALGLGQRAATGLTTFNSFWVYVTPLFGAYIADTYWGRYKTICWAVVIALVGHVLLTVSAIPSVIANPNGSLACFVIAIVVMGVGTGGFKSNIAPLIAEQTSVGNLRVKTLKNGSQVILDPVMTTSRIFMYFYLMINVGALIGQIGMVYAEQRVGFWLAYLLPTVVFLLCPLVLWLGNSRYVKTAPSGSVLGKSMRLTMAAGKGKWLKPKALADPDFWEPVKPSNVEPSKRPSWMTYDDAFVDEVKRGLKACKVFIWYPLWWLTYNQCNNNLVSQAAILDTGGLPNDILSNLDPFALIIIIPICDIFIYPALRRAGINFSPIKKIAAGFFSGALAMLCAAIVQHYAYKTNPCGYSAATCDADPPYSPLNVWIQTPSYVLIALSEIFASITGLEYAFTKAPKSMRSLVMSVFLFMTALSNAIGEAFLPLSNDPLLVWNYGVFGVISLIAAIGFWFSFRQLDRDEFILNEIAEGNNLAVPHPQDKEANHA